jgi:uncharacterized repeat protein (TIGR03837 family)
MTISHSSSSPTTSVPRRWHLFCHVVDNFGDIGVCWRLARQLHREHDCEVTLWVDDLVSFRVIQPEVNPALARQDIDGVCIRHWSAELPPLTTVDIGEVVIEAFACELPAAYLELMQLTRPLWINLEYLSAEEWVEQCHMAPSPRLGMKKFFFFPGFTRATGGLLWEAELEQLQTAAAPSLPSLLQELGVNLTLPDAKYSISLFAYENPAVGGLLDALSRMDVSVHLLVPQGRISAALSDWLGEAMPVSTSTSRGNLTLTALPFMSQRQYDRLLCACDLNFVRGEDSFVRSQLLARPLVWQIYPQQESAHLEKLQAFLARYTADMPGHLAAAVVQAHQCWNAVSDGQPTDWGTLLEQLPHWQKHASQWQQRLLRLGDLASNLVIFSTNKV